MEARTRQHLLHLRRLWRTERDAVARRALAARREIPLRARVAAGEALGGVAVDDFQPAPGGRTMLWVDLSDRPHGDLKIRPGDPLRLWWTDPEAQDVVRATAGPVERARLGVMVEGEPPDRVLEGRFNIDRDDPLATFTRGDRALAATLDAALRSPLGELRAVLWGERRPEFDPPLPSFRPFDPDLDASQRLAVEHALAARDVALVHGPPGTGKTRTLVEVIRQAVARGDRVLACAMSNTAVDNLAEGLIAAGVPLVRLGHPARVAPAIEAHSLDRLLETTEAYGLARSWTAEARRLRHTAHARRDRGRLDRGEFWDMMHEARRLEADARGQLRRAQETLLERLPVVCASAAGADAAVLGDRTFDLLVFDEATQAPDPITLVPLARAPRVVMAGDPEQLPPTVIDPGAEREGLGETLFERLARAAGEAVRMLTVQYRMHRHLMAFPSATRYGGRLEAAASVAGHLLTDLPDVTPDPLRPDPLVLVDTAGKGWDDEIAEDESTRNPSQADRTAQEVRRLLSRGVRAADVALITPYNAQLRLLRARLATEIAQGLEIGTVDGFQGREKEAVVVDLVRSNPAGHVGFVSDRRRLNVALTRARRFLLVIADTATLGQHPDFAAFLEIIEAHGSWVSAWTDEAEPLEP